MSTSNTKNVRVVQNFNRLTTDQLITSGTAVVNDIDGNPKVPNPAVPVDIFKAQLQTLILAAAAAKDGGKKAIAERNKQRAIFIKMMKKQAQHVEEIAGTDVTVVTSAGYQVLAEPVSSQELEQPAIDKITQKNSGQQKVFATPVAARMYQLGHGPAGPDGTVPASWTTLDLANVRPAPVITGLTPGTIYAYRIRAFGASGWTPWSEWVTKMSI